MKYVNVAINLPVKNLFKQFTYQLPPELAHVDVGWRVVVPFGAQTVEGFVVALEAAAPAEYACKEVLATLDTRPWFDAEMLATALWLSEYYLCSPAEAMRLFIPGKTGIKRQAIYNESGKLIAYEYENKLKIKTRTCFGITAAGRAALAAYDKRVRAQMHALTVLAEAAKPMSSDELAAVQVSAATLRTISEKGWAERSEERILRNSYANRTELKDSLQLTEEQRQAVDVIGDAIAGQRQETFLLQGITGSGKTEVYLRAAMQTLEAGKQVLLLVPEIALTAQIVKRFQAWFGDDVAVAHSKLSQNERADVWYKMRTNAAKLLIGVRSAVFAPFADLGLIIIDEEHESSYKQDERPNYHARDVALKRARLSSVPVVLGSATPDLESFYKARQGVYTHLHLLQRANGSLLPQVEIADMRLELQRGNKSVLSSALSDALLQTAAQGEQAIVLLNRRGYSTFVMCRDCGESVVCPHCAVALVYHSTGEAMRCHYCGNTAPIPDECPNCHSRRIRFFGTGTQKAEAEIAELPDIKILRMDQDSTVKKFAHEDILKAFSSGAYNVLLGTQMVAKGHDIPNVTLVGILSADSTLNLPDFRASERTFALLTQAAGRAGRGDKPGHVVLQTYDPQNPVIRLAATQDYDAFAAGELEIRQELCYPPYTNLLKITVLDKDEQRGNTLAQRIVNFLQIMQLENTAQELQVLGPFPAIVAKVRDLYRTNILVKSPQMEAVKQALWQSEFKECRNVYFDVDPISVV
ncbi:primosomal protein N' [uncultured Phascolarctobacterium sp.]|uniref:replication restart helicase PriA n=1 Tax=uncultured Phascolarctobacterium sp. TaxID=512296 RepID=UPI0027D9B8CA|nr:primosomal protein N' [uncultured Phascolarctobacterium sp.]